MPSFLEIFLFDTICLIREILAVPDSRLRRKGQGMLLGRPLVSFFNLLLSGSLGDSLINPIGINAFFLPKVYQKPLQCLVIGH